MSKLPLVIGAALLLALATITTLYHGTFLHRHIPVLGQVSPFELTDDNGTKFQASSLQGKAWVANLFFATCTGPCPLINGKIARMSRMFASNPDIRFVSISVDPEIDRPERLKAYRARFDAHQEAWILLTGDNESAIQEVAEGGFKLGLPGEPALHSTRLVLVDKSGNIRGYYSATDDKAAQKLVNDLSLLASE